jgi:hypothetical protein
MKKTEHAAKAHNCLGYHKHLRKFGKALAHRAVRNALRRLLKQV